jgi:hypothetical protein
MEASQQLLHCISVRALCDVFCKLLPIPTRNSLQNRQQLAEYIAQRSDAYTVEELLRGLHPVPEGNRTRRGSRGVLKSMLLYMAKELAPPKELKVLQTLKKRNDEHNTDIRIAFLPVAHPQLNPIVWSWVKTHVARHNKAYTMEAAHTLTLERVHQITPEMWGKSYLKSKRFAEDCMELENEEFDVPDTDVPQLDGGVDYDAEDDDDSAFPSICN